MIAIWPVTHFKNFWNWRRPWSDSKRKEMMVPLKVVGRMMKNGRCLALGVIGGLTAEEWCFEAGGNSN